VARASRARLPARIGERFGRYAADAPRPRGEVVWIHAVSLGETRAAEPLVRRIAQARPHATILLTSMTATGREAGRALDRQVIQRGSPTTCRRGERVPRPLCTRAGLLMETSSGRTRPRLPGTRGADPPRQRAHVGAFGAGYRKFARADPAMLEALAGIAAQTPSDAQRLEALGARDVTVTGSLKFDMTVPDAMVERGAGAAQALRPRAPVWLAASTRDGEEALLLDAMAQGTLPADALLLLVPRHPQRFDAVFALAEARGLACVRRSSELPVEPTTRVVLGDSLARCSPTAAAADVAFRRRQPAAARRPEPAGADRRRRADAGRPHTFNFAETTERAIEAGAARRVADAEALIREVDALLRRPQERAVMRKRRWLHGRAPRRCRPALGLARAPSVARNVSRPGGG